MTQVTIDERVVHYPIDWERQYREHGVVDAWTKYPEMYERNLHRHHGRLISGKHEGSLMLFAQYALQYLLREPPNRLHSVTRYRLRAEKPRVNREWVEQCREHMRRQMTADRLDTFRALLKDGHFNDLTGEPDLFCWRDEPTPEWFFAEAKLHPHDPVSEKQLRWMGLCYAVFGPRAHIYRVAPDAATAVPKRYVIEVPTLDSGL